MSEPATIPAEGVDRVTEVMGTILHHVQDQSEWHLPFLPPVPLPDFISLHGMMLVLAVVFLVLIFLLVFRHGDGAPSGMTNLLEVFVVFVRDEISIANLGEKEGRRMAPVFCSFFFFVLMLNLMGMIPLFASATANVSVTAALGVTTLAFMIGGGIYKNGVWGFFKSFVPQGVPWPILILLVPIEFMGFFIKAFALAIRLFANMLGGHIVLFSLLGLILIFGIFASPPAVALAVAIFGLEVFVALLQTYIFTFLSAMFIGQTMHPEH